jgi:subtilisin family serine protease
MLIDFVIRYVHVACFDLTKCHRDRDKTMKKTKLICLVFTTILIQTTFHVSAGELSPGLLERLQSIEQNDYTSVILRMSKQTNLKTATKGIIGKNKALRSKNVIKALQTTATESQKDLIAFLEKEKALDNVSEYTLFWIFNGLSLRATPQVIEKIASRNDIEIVSEDLSISLPARLSSTPLQSDPLYTWNIKRIKAPEVWDMGYDGSGVVVGIFDTGVDYTNPDLAEKYRGGDNSWFDPYGEHDQPYDPSGHGTLNAGIIIGGTNPWGKHIGVAPGAKWIAAKLRNDAGEGAQISDMHKGFQWFMDPDGDPETDDAPDVVNCSWGTTLFSVFTWCSSNFRDDIKAWRTAGIIPVFAAGNLGVFPFFSGSSPATYPETISVGATDFFDIIFSVSSRGPSNCDLSIFPDITAPGLSILSSSLDGVYSFVAGTSVAAPHVTGTIALMLNANPNLTFEDVRTTLRETAKPLGFLHPNNTYGWGRVDALKAVTEVMLKY